jgi:hypothetical protein
LHSIVEEDNKEKVNSASNTTNLDQPSNNNNHSNASTASSSVHSSRGGGGGGGIMITANSSAHDKRKSGGLLSALLGTMEDDSCASFAEEEDVVPATTSISSISDNAHQLTLSESSPSIQKLDDDTTATALTRTSTLSMEPVLETSAIKSHGSSGNLSDTSPPQDGAIHVMVPNNKKDIFSDLEYHAKRSPSASPTRTSMNNINTTTIATTATTATNKNTTNKQNIHNKNNKERLMKAAAKAVEDMPVRKSRRQSADSLIPFMMADGSGKFGSVRRSRSDDPSMNNSEMEVSMEDGSGRIGKPLRRSQSSDGVHALGRMRRAGRRSMEDSSLKQQHRPLARTRSNDAACTFAKSARGRGLRNAVFPFENGDGKVDARNNKNGGFRRSKSSVTGPPDEAAGTDDNTRSLSPSQRSLAVSKDTGFGSNHPSRFNSSRIRRWDKDDVGGKGFTSSNFGGNELEKMLKSASSGLY